ncbi:MBOAT family O-acyltransferase [Pedobacter sp. P351]|uniref:MBOAT family O-acyltransferase n=1 Tax=Pedobacter superstes TaxID=3133441 RepID=UPI0030A94331
MLLNSEIFLVFFILFFLLYWLVFNKNLKLQNILVLAASYIFYAWSDWRFLSFLIFASALNFYLGIYISKNTRYKRLLLYIGLLQGLGSLAYFKYFNFFIDSFKEAFQSFNIHLNVHTLNILIPLGISYFTFKTISYLLDINKGKIKPTTDWIVFFAYVSFFPTLLSGPIDNAKSFIPQLEKKRPFDYIETREGLRQILWGVFKKMVIADKCALIVNPIFDDYQNMPGSTLLVGAFFYTIQIYTDFSGYSDMAIGIARLIGFRVTKNFDYPFFAQNIAEFWRKWHMSLTSWLTEYVFTPLNIYFRDYGKLGLIAAIIINFVVVGIWHGANWTFVLFGFLHGCYFIPLILRGTFNKKKKIAKNSFLPSFSELTNVLLTFTLVMLTYIVFRADNISQAFNFYKILFSESLFSIPLIPSGRLVLFTTTLFIFLMMLVEWLQREKEYGLQIDLANRPAIRLSIYYILIFAIILFSTDNENQFIYFKF